MYTDLKKNLALVNPVVPLCFIWLLGGPMTYVLLVMDTWASSLSTPAKWFLILTWDVVATGIWPAIWLFWAASDAAGYHTPLTVFLD
jgi:hypothetical protein